MSRGSTISWRSRSPSLSTAFLENESGNALSLYRFLERLKSFARQVVIEHARDEAGRGPDFVQVDARFDAHAVQHVEQVFGSEVTGGARSVRAAPEPAAARIEDRDAVPERRVNVGQRR